MRRQGGFASTGITLVVAAFLAAAVGLGTAWWMAQPDRGIGQFERLGAEIGCMCGTCPNRPIATCGCGFAERMLEELQVLVDEGHTDDEIVDTFVARYTDETRIKPRGSGMDLSAWAAPMILFSVGAVLLGILVVRWTQRGAGPPAGGDSSTPAAPHLPDAEIDSDAEERLRERVDRELRELDS